MSQGSRHRILARAVLLGALAAPIAAPVAAQEATTAPGGVVRVLDKITGVVTDVELAAGEDRRIGHLTLRLGECRYPTSNPSGDAYAELAVTYRDIEAPVFQGWMIASAPALNALDHPRYDVWPLRCRTDG